MDRLDAMRLFTRVVERRSFTLAAQDLGLPRSTVTEAVKQLESAARRAAAAAHDAAGAARRSTARPITGAACAILADIEEAEGAFAGAKPKGLLRVDVQGTLARHFLMPGLPRFLARLSGDRARDERERPLGRPGARGRRLRAALRRAARQRAGRAPVIAAATRITCAAPAYLERFGTPPTPDDLDAHRMVGLRSITTGALAPFEFLIDKRPYAQSTCRRRSRSPGTESYPATACASASASRKCRCSISSAIWRRPAGAVCCRDDPLPPAPVSVLYPRNRQLSPRVRVFIDWIVQRFSISGGNKRSPA